MRLHYALASSLVLAACGGGGSDNQETTSAAAEAPAVAVPPASPSSPSTTVVCTSLDGITTTCRERENRPIEGIAVVVPTQPPAEAPAPVAAVQPDGTVAPAPTPPRTAPPVVVVDPAPTVPPPSPGAAPTPSPAPTAPAPAADQVPSRLVLSALVTGISEGTDYNPYAGYDRQLLNGNSEIYYMGTRMETYTTVMAPWLRVMVYGAVMVEPTIDSAGRITAVRANGLDLSGPDVDLGRDDAFVSLDQTAGTWRSGDWYAQLVVQSTDDSALMRVCWNVQLPAPEPVTGPPDTDPVVRPYPFKRLSCGIFPRYVANPSVGGYMVDDYGGRRSTFTARWR